MNNLKQFIQDKLCHQQVDEKLIINKNSELVYSIESFANKYDLDILLNDTDKHGGVTWKIYKLSVSEKIKDQILAFDDYMAGSVSAKIKQYSQNIQDTINLKDADLAVSQITNEISIFPYNKYDGRRSAYIGIFRDKILITYIINKDSKDIENTLIEILEYIVNPHERP